MLRSKYVAFLFCLVSTIANAAPFKINREAICEKVTVVLKELVDQFGEQPIWQGKNIQSLTGILMVNPNSKSWTYIVTDGEHACVIDSGTGYSEHKAEAVPQTEKQKKPSKLTDI